MAEATPHPWFFLQGADAAAVSPIAPPQNGGTQEGSTVPFGWLKLHPTHVYLRGGEAAVSAAVTSSSSLHRWLQNSCHLVFIFYSLFLSWLFFFLKNGGVRSERQCQCFPLKNKNENELRCVLGKCEQAVEFDAHLGGSGPGGDGDTQW